MEGKRGPLSDRRRRPHPPPQGYSFSPAITEWRAVQKEHQPRTDEHAGQHIGEPPFQHDGITHGPFPPALSGPLAATRQRLAPSGIWGQFWGHQGSRSAIVGVSSHAANAPFHVHRMCRGATRRNLVPRWEHVSQAEGREFETRFPLHLNRNTDGPRPTGAVSRMRGFGDRPCPSRSR